MLSASTGLTLAILLRLVVFIFGFHYRRLCSVMIFIEVAIVLCHASLPVTDQPADSAYLQELTKLVIFQYICYNCNFMVSIVLLLSELFVLNFMLNPLMHSDPASLWARVLTLVFYLAVIVPLFILSEWCILNHYNKLVRGVHQSEDYQTLLNKTSNPFFVLNYKKVKDKKSL